MMPKRIRFNLVVQGDGISVGQREALRTISRATGAHQQARTTYGDVWRFTGADMTFSEDIAAYCETRKFDCAWIPAGTTLADFRLLAMDMDSTLITIECIDELADYAGVKKEVSAVTAAAMRGEIVYAESLMRRLSLLKGVHEDALEEVYQQRLKLSPGAEQLISAAKQHGIKLLLVSGGFTFFTDRLKERLGFDETLSNVLEVKFGHLTGRLESEITDALAKARKLVAYREQLGVARAQCIAIGDGANDINMLAEAGLSVAYHAKPVVREKATVSIRFGGLDFIIAMLEGDKP